MKLFKYIKSLISNTLNKETKQQVPIKKEKEIPKKAQTHTNSFETAYPLLTISQTAKKHGVTRQAIFFAIKMERLNASKETGTWLIAQNDLDEYLENRYSRTKSKKEGELIFDKRKGFYSVEEAAKYLNKNVNHIYYLVRLGKLKSHRKGTAIVIQDTELHSYSKFINKKNQKAM